MPDERQRGDAAFDKALTRELGRQTDSPDECPDAEIIAAYWEGSLSADERQQYDAHIAACHRCQTHLVTLARLEEDTRVDGGEAPVSGRFRSLVDWRWVVPVATAAVIMLAVWVVDPGTITDPATETVADVDIANRTTANGPEAAQTMQAPRRERQDIQVAEQEGSDDESDARDTPAQAAPEAQPTPAESTVRDTLVDEVQPPQQSAAAEELAERRLTLRSLDAVGAVAPLGERSEVGGSVVVSSPTGSATWRLTTDGGVELSTDGGASWLRQLSAPGSELVAGAAVSPSICWIVGRRGAIFRTVDGGESWEGLTAPRTGDLVEVDASDAQSAMIEFADGAAFRTDDGGATWQPE